MNQKRNEAARGAARECQRKVLVSRVDKLAIAPQIATSVGTTNTNITTPPSLTSTHHLSFPHRRTHTYMDDPSRLAHSSARCHPSALLAQPQSSTRSSPHACPRLCFPSCLMRLHALQLIAAKHDKQLAARLGAALVHGERYGAFVLRAAERSGRGRGGDERDFGGLEGLRALSE